MTDAIDRLDWPALGLDLLERGYARAEGVLSPDACAAFRACWGRDGLFRRLIVMERHGYGEGAYGLFRRSSA